jgi:DNA mismatch repair protein MSH5
VHFLQHTLPSEVFETDGTDQSQDNTRQFQFIFMQDEIHYFKHEIVLAMDDSLGDVKSTIMDRQKLLMLQIEDTLLDVEPQLQHFSIVMATIDALLSLGTLASEQNLVRPEMVDESVIMVKNGRHLLQEMTVDSFVPNDTFISTDKNVALITGPNTSGKSVYLKQVGLLVYLAHIGSFVPCDKAIIGLTDRILTRINSVETVSSPQSSFSLDLHQTSRILSSHTSRSLCLLDEFGKGTAPVDGIALLAATVKHFINYKGRAMFVLHFTEIVNDLILNEKDMKSIQCFRMETHKNPSPSSLKRSRAMHEGQSVQSDSDTSDEGT